MSFAALGLVDALLRALEASGHANPTPIQSATIPATLAGRDVIGAASTGSGKTLAFALPILQRLTESADAQRATQALVMTPTRELAEQAGETFRALAQYLPQRVKVVTLVGGGSINPQLMALRGGADIVVATPGRLLDVVSRRREADPARHGGLHLARVRTLVLDEADRLLEQGFAEELAQVLQLLPPQRQHLLFSATFPQDLLALARQMVVDPLVVGVPEDWRQDSSVICSVPELPAQILQRAVEVETARRTPLLRHLIQSEGWDRVLVFVATRYATEHLANKLNGAGFAAAALHGELSAGARTWALAGLKSEKLRVLVATDMAARGLDIDALPAVVNYDLARSPEIHVHRVGRTGRAGMAGVAVSFIASDQPGQEAHFRLIEKRQGRRVPRERVPGFEPSAERAGATDEGLTPVTLEDAAASAARGLDPHGGIKGRRPSKKDKLRQAAAAAAVRMADPKDPT